MSSFTRAQIITAAKALPANEDLELLAWALGFKAGTQPFCNDGGLEDLCTAIVRGAKIGVDAFQRGEVGRNCEPPLSMADVLENIRRAGMAP